MKTLSAGERRAHPGPAPRRCYRPRRPRGPEVTTHLPILQHALGLDEYGRGRPYRNHYVTDGTECDVLVAAGLMVRHPPREISGGMPIFVVTDAGKAYVREHSPPPPKASRGRTRYLRWLAFSDISDEPFGAWLKRKGWKDREAVGDHQEAG